MYFYIFIYTYIYIIMYVYVGVYIYNIHNVLSVWKWGMPQHGHKMTVFIWIGKMRQSPKMAKSWKSKGQSLGAAINPGYLPQMFGRVRWLGWNLRVQWLPFSWYAGGWNGIWLRGFYKLPAAMSCSVLRESKPLRPAASCSTAHADTKFPSRKKGHQGGSNPHGVSAKFTDNEMQESEESGTKGWGLGPWWDPNQQKHL